MYKKIIFTFFAVFTIVTSCNFTNKKEKMESKNEYKIFVLNDVIRQGSSDILISPDPDTLKKYIPDGTYPSAINAFLVQRNDSNFLFDTGTGLKLVENLATHGVKPEDVHKIFITHCHFDHIGGLLKDGQVVFPNAELYINKIEYDYWLKVQNELFLQVVEKYKNQLKIFDIDNKNSVSVYFFFKLLLCDIKAISAYGHTPGHTIYLVGNAEKQTLIWGDLAHVMPIQMPHPEYSVTYDSDSEQAAKSRQFYLKMAAEQNLKIAGMHIFEGIGIVKSNGKGGYDFEYIKE